MNVVTRFAPSPTGFLHIGGARTALFNWLFSRGAGGRFLLRIEDTDRERSTQAAIDAIIDGMAWLGLDADEPPLFQFARADRHRAAAQSLIDKGLAFRCYVSPEALKEQRTQQESDIAKLRGLRARLQDQQTTNGLDSAIAAMSRSEAEAAEARLAATLKDKQRGFRSPYRDGGRPPEPNAPWVVRLRAPDTGEVVIDDQVQGPVRTPAQDIDDLVLLRSDGTPTYMLAVVVDDADMGVTHVIRGDDHLTNAARQAPIIDAMGWDRPVYAHVPMIHGIDGAKLSKRHGALAVQSYRDMGYLPEALTAYLMRLGWSPGHDEILTLQEAAPLFRLQQLGKAPARLDVEKLNFVNAQMMRSADLDRLAALVLEASGAPVSPAFAERLRRALPALRLRGKTILEIRNLAGFLAQDRPIVLDDKARNLVKGEANARLRALRLALADASDWNEEALAELLKVFAAAQGVGLGAVGPPLRMALTGGAAALDLAQILAALGRDETLARLDETLL
jgi:glutamyl-tRNA synthetase